MNKKHWNASYLVTYGLQDNWQFSFHGTADYRGTAERWGNDYHDSIYHAPVDNKIDSPESRLRGEDLTTEDSKGHRGLASSFVSLCVLCGWALASAG